MIRFVAQAPRRSCDWICGLNLAVCCVCCSPRRVALTRVLVLTPTRELAAQVHAMSRALAKHTDVRIALVVGGLSLQVQEAELRSRPDVVIATPGRMIDHLRNALSVHMEVSVSSPAG